MRERVYRGRAVDDREADTSVTHAICFDVISTPVMNPSSPTAPVIPIHSHVDRREFLRRGVALGVGAPLVAGASRAMSWHDVTAPAGPPSAASSWSEVRAQFDLDPAVIHMSGFFLVSHPRPV